VKTFLLELSGDARFEDAFVDSWMGLRKDSLREADERSFEVGFKGREAYQNSQHSRLSKVYQ